LYGSEVLEPKEKQVPRKPWEGVYSLTVPWLNAERCVTWKAEKLADEAEAAALVDIAPACGSI
jgi:hypothetical protein